MRMKRILITIDPDCEKHLAAYKLSGLSASYVLREALKRYAWQIKPKAPEGSYDGIDITYEE